MKALFFAIAVALTPGLLAGQEPGKTHFVRASGEATVTAKPDRAQVSLGVITQAPTAQAAAAGNAAQTTIVLGAVKKSLGASGDVRTEGYSVTPQYEYLANRPPKITGYQASNVVLVTVNELSILGQVIDSASSSGANNINGISFSLRDETASRTQALSEAASKARSSAEAIAKALNLKVVGVLQAEVTEQPAFRPMPRAFASAKMEVSSPTPIEAGDLDIRAAVTVTLEVQ